MYLPHSVGMKRSAMSVYLLRVIRQLCQSNSPRKISENLSDKKAYSISRKYGSQVSHRSSPSDSRSRARSKSDDLHHPRQSDSSSSLTRLAISPSLFRLPKNSANSSKLSQEPKMSRSHHKIHLDSLSSRSRKISSHSTISHHPSYTKRSPRV